MTQRDHANDPIYRELRAVSEENAQNASREAFVNNDDLALAGQVIGYLRDLPPWAQACIKALRGELWDERYK